MISLSESENTNVFQVANLTVAGLTVFSGLSLLFSGFQSFFLGLSIVAFGATIGLLEFSIPSRVYSYASFLFSFIGRGVAYTVVGIAIGGSSWFRLFVAIVIVLIGLGFIAVEFVPSVDLPANMNPAGMGMALQDEDVV